ncbi:hypothetical protein [Nevskia sp.]|uniref:hypothetical protein n=1 Tax=Nevskia sp. TaxID=1929292 RepID=UPI0025CF3445|nr:hypothetical protein [Nevskia sp.]
MNPRPQVVATTRRSSAVDLELLIGADLPQFVGHFAEAPMVAGLVQVDWAIGFGRDHFPQLPPRFVSISALKFMRVIQPGDRPCLSLTGDDTALRFRYWDVRGDFSSGDIAFADA